MSEPTIRVLSLGAGRQSTTIALLSAEGVLPKLDAAIFADTGWEPQGVYDHLDRLERDVLKPAGIPLYRVSNGRLRDDVLDPNKMRSIPAHTRGEREVQEPIRWRDCDCTWAAMRRWLIEHRPDDPGILGMLHDCWELDIDDAEMNEVAVRMMRDLNLTNPPDLHEGVCGFTGRIPVEWHTETVVEDGMLNRRCTQIYKLQPILAQVRLLLGAQVGEERLCKKCDGRGERNAPWRAKLGDYTTGPCSVCDGVGTLSRIGQPPAGVWAEQWIGFSADEVERVSNRGDTRYSRSRYPLLELDMSVTQCLAYLKSKGWDKTKKSACIGCPFHGNAAWRTMRDTCVCGHHKDDHWRGVGEPLRCAHVLNQHEGPEAAAVTCGCPEFRTPDWDNAVKFDHEYRTGPGMRHQRFLHISRKPLDQAPIDRIQPKEFLQPSLLDASVELDLERLENGDPDGCSPWACRSGEAVT